MKNKINIIIIQHSLKNFVSAGCCNIISSSPHFGQYNTLFLYNIKGNQNIKLKNGINNNIILVHHAYVDAFVFTFKLLLQYLHVFLT